MNEALEESYDAFLGGKVHAYQARNGFRAGTDTVLLAAAVPARMGQEVLEIGAGSGVGLLCLGTRVSGLKLCGIEILDTNAARANRNLQAAGLNGEVICEDAFASQQGWSKRQFDHVFMNPPFYAQFSNSMPKNDEKRFAHNMERPVGDWVKLGLKRVRAQGTLVLIFPSEGLAEILSAIPKGNAVIVQPIATVEGTDPKRVIVRVQIQRRSPLRLQKPIVLQSASGAPTSEAENVMREGHALWL